MFEDGTWNKLFKSGLLPLKAFTYREIYLFVDIQMRVHFKGKEKAVQEAEDKFRVSRQTIYIALRHFEK